MQSPLLSETDSSSSHNSLLIEPKKKQTMLNLKKKTKEFLTEERVPRSTSMNLYLHLKWPF